MPCECEAMDTRAVNVGGCILTVTVKSKCEQITHEESISPPVSELMLEGLGVLIDFWRVTYTISNATKSKASIREFSVDGESFEFPTMIGPGTKGTVVIIREKPADCEKKKAGIIKAEDSKGKKMTLDKLEVCVLS